MRYPLFNIVMTIRADSSEKGTNHSVGFALTDDESRDVYKNEPLQFDVPVGTKTPYTELSFIFVITDLILPKFGFYQFQVVIDGRIVRQIDLILQPLILPREG